MTKQILVYADSLSWGIIPGTRERYSFDTRWPGVLENRLNDKDQEVRIIEDCLNGRRTVWDDPYKPGRNGLQRLAQSIESHSPLSLVIMMLGVNDFQSMHQHTAWHSAQGIDALVREIKTAPIEPGMPVPPVLILAPPSVHNPSGSVAPKFFNADIKMEGLAAAYREISAAIGCHFFDTGSIVTASSDDGVHLDAEAHIKLGESLVDIVIPIIGKAAEK